MVGRIVLVVIDALWIGSFEARLPDGTVLTPGVTTYKVSEGEANASDNWQPVTPIESRDLGLTVSNVDPINVSTSTGSGS